MEKIKNIIKVSVRNLVEFVLMSGDIVSGFSGSSRNTEAIKAHQIVQKSSTEDYSKEVSVNYRYEKEDLIFEINGRIDGVIKRVEGIVIDEIKTTTRDLEFIDENYNNLHWAQGKCYAYIYGLENDLELIQVQLTYYQLDTKEIKRFIKTFSMEELKVFFGELVEDYLSWAKTMKDWNEVRDHSIGELCFPFENYRKGQRELAVGVYRTIKEGSKFFAQAPTGIGKTMATLFPAIKALGESHVSKIFYLTAKTITRTIAEGAISNLREKGLDIKSITLTAKEKICFKEEQNCNPEHCEYAKGHYDRVKDAIADIFKESTFTREVIECYSKKHVVCPFEFSLDLSYWVDCIICDYNYVFDPRVNLKRFFQDGGGDFAFLIDEAHNLVDRAREMFSAELFKKSMLELKKNCKYIPRLNKSLSKLNNFMIECRKKCEEEEKDFYTQKEAPKEIYPLLSDFIKVSEEFLLNNETSPIKEQVLELYFKSIGFMRTAEYYDERYVTYIEKIGGDIKLKIFCLDPSDLLKEAMKRGKASVLFSATLSPLDYFMEILGGDEKSYKLRLASPFPRENLKVIIEDKVSTKYKMRELTYDKVTKSIQALASGRIGNYFAFFPSYQYMNEVYRRFIDENEGIKTIIQNNIMSEEEREIFLKEFSEEENKSMMAFAVMGGIFGEGIDLSGDRLSGAVIVGVGLPQIGFERDIIKDYFKEKKGKGFEYAYVYPGINKVLQAVGRVIRTEKDRGVAVLIDDRFAKEPYKSLLPVEWQLIKNVNNIEDKIKEFWSVK